MERITFSHDECTHAGRATRPTAHGCLHTCRNDIPCSEMPLRAYSKRTTPHSAWSGGLWGTEVIMQW